MNHQWGINFDIQAIQSPQLTRYVAPGGHYDYHLDSTGVWPEGDSGLVRKLSMVCLLNDRSEFEGGDFEFKLCSNPMQISLNKGDVLVFPLCFSKCFQVLFLFCSGCFYVLYSKIVFS